MDEGSRFGHSRGDRMLGLGELSIDSDREGGVHAIRLTGELDLATATALQRELDRAEAGDADAIVLDLSGLKFVDSSGVRLLVEASSRARADSHRLALLRGPAAVQRVFELSQVDELLPFAD